MSDLPLRESGSAFERDLLASAKLDVPDGSARERTMLALGLGASAVLGGAAGGSALGAGALQGAAGAAGAQAIKSASALAVVKWVGIGLVAGGVASGAATQVAKRPSAPNPVATIAPAVVSVSAQSTAANPRVAAPAPSAITEAPPAASAAAPALAAGVAEELAVLDRAREALARGDSSAALKALDEHTRRFAGGALGPEAALLHIEASARAGKRAQALAETNRFLARYADSPLAQRARTLKASLEPDEPARPAAEPARPAPATTAPEATPPAAPEPASNPGSVAGFPPTP